MLSSQNYYSVYLSQISFGKNSLYSMFAEMLLQAIYFKDPAALFRGLRAVSGDMEVRLLRVVNRLHEEYPAAVTAGYRDVLVNLSLSTAETRRLGIDAVVCELQLCLICFAKIKVPQQ